MNGDGFLSPLDALLIINFLNSAGASPEGEATGSLEWLATSATTADVASSLSSVHVASDTAAAMGPESDAETEPDERLGIFARVKTWLDNATQQVSSLFSREPLARRSLPSQLDWSEQVSEPVAALSVEDVLSDLAQDVQRTRPTERASELEDAVDAIFDEWMDS